MLILTEIKKNYNGRTVLDVERMEFERGNIYAVLGPNGSGKSTMLKIIAGIEQPDSGSIDYKGNISHASAAVAYLPQETYLFDMTVMKNITVTMDKDKNPKIRAREILENVNMNGFADSSARSLSGGEAQRVAVARALALERELVLLDEPAASIDILSSTLVEKYIVKTNQETGSTVIFTTHNPSQAARIANQVIIMWEGKIIEKGRPSEIFDFPLRDETREFLGNWRI